MNNHKIQTFLIEFSQRYTEARKDREKFRKRLVEVIMHRDEWDDEDAEPGNFKRVALKIQFHEKI